MDQLTELERAQVERLRTVAGTPAEVTDGSWQIARDELAAGVPHLLDIIDRLAAQGGAVAGPRAGELDPA